MNIAALIGIMVALVIGINLIGPINKIVEQSAINPETPSSVVSLMGILPIIFVATLILGAFAFLGGDVLGNSSEGKEDKPKLSKNPNNLLELMEKQSKPWEEYINNLDEYLGIVTKNTNESALYLWQDRTLDINNKEYDWYIVDKHPDLPIFKVVGLHKKDSNKNAVYILGKNEQGKPYLIKVDEQLKYNTVSKWIKQNDGQVSVISK